MSHRSVPFLLLAVLGLAAAAPPWGAPAAAAGTAPTALYVVQTAGDPAATYAGGVSGIPETAPAAGHRLDAGTWNYAAYRDHLRRQHATLARAAGVGVAPLVEYTTVFNGFGARLTTAQVARLRATPGVVAVYKSRTYSVRLAPATPAFLGLDGSAGVWQQRFGGADHAGRGVIVGDIDSGYWPENPSFAPLPGPRADQPAIDRKWGTGAVAAAKCQPGDDHPVTCNDKVIGARWFDSAGYADQNPKDYHSPRDENGHGSHTAATAAGDTGVPVSVHGTDLGTVSGVAPAARLAIYKVLWENADGTDANGNTVDIVAAVDQAVADGVDVLNFSVGDDTDTIGPEEQAFLDAAAAGVFVSAAAGNNGDAGQATVDNAEPWVTTVAASSHDRAYRRTVTLGDGRRYPGAGIGNTGLPATALVDAAHAAAPGKKASDAELCTPGDLDPATVTGRIVLCKRGVVDRVDKSRAVKEAGGVGMILYNPSEDTLNADFHSVPTIHVDQTAGAAIKSYIAGAAAPTAALTPGAPVSVEAPAMADFSSVGPSVSSGGDLLKPDLTAPGSDVLAAVAPPGHDGQDFDFESGTSMATPHVSGLAALLRSAHPDWSPMAIKSALMTTAGQLDNRGKPIMRGSVAATPLDFGAGHVRPAPAFDPGLVYDSTPADWLRYACGVDVHLVVGAGAGQDVCPLVGTRDPSDLNYPSLAVGDLAGAQTLSRTVTNVSDRSSTYVAAVAAPSGVRVSVSPSVLVVAPGRSASFRVTLARTTAAYDTWAFGSLSWKDLRGHSVRSPIAVQPVVVSAPASVSSSGPTGTSVLPLRTGFTGPLTAAPHGLDASTVTERTLTGTSTTFDSSAPAAGPAVARVPVTVPAGTALSRVATYAADYGDGADLDLYAYDADGNLIGQSGGGTADESIDLPRPGRYDIYVVQYAVPDGVTAQRARLNTFLVPPVAAGNLTATPATQQVRFGGRAQVTVGWRGLVTGRHYLGEVAFGDGTAVRATTVVAVDG